MGTRRKVGAACIAALVLALTGCESVKRITSSTYQDGLRCMAPALSGNGTYVVFDTLDDPSGLGAAPKSYVRNVDSGASTVLPGLGTSTQALSAGGGLVVFDKAYGSVSRIALLDRASGSVTPVSPAGESNEDAVISGDGQRIAYRSDNGSAVWLYGRASGTRVQITPDLPRGSSSYFTTPHLSKDGRFATYVRHDLGGLVGDVAVYDLKTHERWSLFSPGDSSSGDAGGSISADGRFVAYSKARPGVAGGTQQVYVWDRTTGSSTRITGAAAPYASGDAVISGDGKRLAFVRGDQRDSDSPVVLVLDRATKQQIARIDGNHHVVNPSISTDGHRIAFCSDATDLAKGSPEAPNVYVWSDE